MTEVRPTEADYEAALAEYLDAIAEVAHATLRRDEAAATLLRLGEGGSYTSRLGSVTVSAPARRFSPELAAQKLPPALVEQCSETVISSTKAKRVLPPALYAECSTPAKGARPVLRVKPVKAVA